MQRPEFWPGILEQAAIKLTKDMQFYMVPGRVSPHFLTAGEQELKLDAADVFRLANVLWEQAHPRLTTFKVIR
jgi:hypothetical protein